MPMDIITLDRAQKSYERRNFHIGNHLASFYGLAKLRSPASGRLLRRAHKRNPQFAHQSRRADKVFQPERKSLRCNRKDALRFSPSLFLATFVRNRTFSRRRLRRACETMGRIPSLPARSKSQTGFQGNSSKQEQRRCAVVSPVYCLTHGQGTCSIEVTSTSNPLNLTLSATVFIGTKDFKHLFLLD